MASREEFDSWLTEFRFRRDDLHGLLEKLHFGGGNPYGVNLHTNIRAKDAVTDALQVIEAMFVMKRDSL